MWLKEEGFVDRVSFGGRLIAFKALLALFLLKN